MPHTEGWLIFECVLPASAAEIIGLERQGLNLCISGIVYLHLNRFRSTRFSLGGYGQPGDRVESAFYLAAGQAGGGVDRVQHGILTILQVPGPDSEFYSCTGAINRAVSNN